LCRFTRVPRSRPSRVPLRTNLRFKCMFTRQPRPALLQEVTALIITKAAPTALLLPKPLSSSPRLLPLRLALSSTPPVPGSGTPSLLSTPPPERRSAPLVPPTDRADHPNSNPSQPIPPSSSLHRSCSFGLPALKKNRIALPGPDPAPDMINRITE